MIWEATIPVTSFIVIFWSCLHSVRSDRATGQADFMGPVQVPEAARPEFARGNPVKFRKLVMEGRQSDRLPFRLHAELNSGCRKHRFSRSTLFVEFCQKTS